MILQFSGNVWLTVKATLASHVITRVVGLIVLPLMVYMFSFYIHFLVLENSGPGDEIGRAHV